MKNLILTITVLLLLVGPVSAQTIITNTTTNGAVTAAAGSVVVTSATGFTVGNYMYVDYEAMRITAINGLNIVVVRGQLGTAASPHVTASRVLTGNVGHFRTLNHGFPPPGACTRGTQPFLPIIDPVSGNIWSCRSAGVWVGTNVAPLVFNSVQVD